MIEGFLFNNKTVKVSDKARNVGGSWCKDMNAFEQDVIAKFYNEIIKMDSPVILDIGANTGSFCLLAVYHPNMICWAFEPVIPIYEILIENINLNKLEKRVFPVNMGISDYTGEGLAWAYTTEGYSGLSGINEFKPAHSYIPHKYNVYNIQVSTLDDFRKSNNLTVDAMKIDVEGSGPKVLRGAEKTISIDRPFIVIEHTTTEKTFEWKWLEKHGYECELFRYNLFCIHKDKKEKK